MEGNEVRLGPEIKEVGFEPGRLGEGWMDCTPHPETGGAFLESPKRVCFAVDAYQDEEL